MRKGYRCSSLASLGGRLDQVGKKASFVAVDSGS